MTSELTILEAFPLEELKRKAPARGDSVRNILAQQREDEIEKAIDAALVAPENVIPVALGDMKVATFRIRLAAVLDRTKKVCYVSIRGDRAYFCAQPIPGSRGRKPKK